MHNEEFELVNFVCSKCGQTLVQALPSSRVLCRKCNHWVEQESRGRKIYGAGIKKYSMSVVCK
ncbi:hypothetical protein [Pelosinus sp. sgz500959]|uniref:hypothetical protein n=1 Tax=Pelosinus sp. sgz500959 TaxID=3242472 RepID=UPI00366FDA1F